MARKRTFSRSKSLSWFRLSPQTRGGWAQLHIPPKEAKEWVAAVIKLWFDPQTRPAMVGIWKKILVVQAMVQDVLQTSDWSQAGSQQLVALAEAYVALRIAMETFLPPDFADLPPAARRCLYTSGQILVGLQEADEGGDPPLLRVHLSTLVYMAAPYVNAELVRREPKHVGFPAAKWLFLMDALRRVGDVDRSDLESALEVLRRSAWRMTPPDKREDLTGQIPLTLHDRWGHLDPVEALARSLDGELDIAPRAIRDELAKEIRRERRTREIEIIFQARPGEDETSAEDWQDVLPSLDWGPEEETRWREDLRRIKMDPRLSRLVRAALEGAGSQKQFAAALGVDPRTVRNWMARLRRELEG